MLCFKNLSRDYRLVLPTKGGQPQVIVLDPGQFIAIAEAYMQRWDWTVKQDAAAYVGKGVLEIIDEVTGLALPEATVALYS